MYRAYERAYGIIEFVRISRATAYSGVVLIQLPLSEIIWRFDIQLLEAFYIARLYTPPHSFVDTYVIEMLNEGS